MADKTTELERIYTIPLRKAKDLTRSRRADNAIRDVKRYLERHMKSENVWLDHSVNEHLWSKGKYNIPSRIRVKATRFSDGVIEVTLPESTATGSLRDSIQTRREKAAASPVLKAPEAPEAEEGHTHGPNDGRPVTDVKGIGAATAEKLGHAGIATLHDLAHADPAKIVDTVGGSADKAKSWIDDAKAILEGKADVADVKSQDDVVAQGEDAAKDETKKE